MVGAGGNQPPSGTLVVGAVLLTAILIRLAIGLHSYSGIGVWPTFGDYEAQRHWMEVTTNLPSAEWYQGSAMNDLSYWGLDYPPLSAYQSWVCGKLIGAVEPMAMVLDSSRGYETPSSKLLMRLTVLLSDLLFYFPAALACVVVMGRGQGRQRQLHLLIALLLCPALLLTDHGHFQYNCISLGLSAGAAAAVVAGWDALGSVLFVLALNHKQMSLYLAPAFFGYLLGKALALPTLAQKVGMLAKLGLAVLATFALVWAPFLSSAGGALAVVGRVFPTQRGLYEDYVANFWCVSSLVIKWKRLLSQPALVRACLLGTLAAFTPSVASQILRPSRRGLLLCMANSAMAFFLLSYQVHEKSILLPLLPLSLWAVEVPELAAWANLVAPFSMFPLLKKDGLSLPYLAVLLLYCAAVLLVRTSLLSGRRREARPALGLAGLPPMRAALRWGPAVSVAVAATLHAVASVVEPPSPYPFLWDAAMMSWSFLHFAALFAYTNAEQWLEFKRAKPQPGGRRKAA